MNKLVPFTFEASEVRVLSRDGEPWFILADVCRALELSNPSMAGKGLDDDEVITIDTLNNTDGLTDPRAQTIRIVNESGLYSLILTSRKPAAKRFKKGVTAEVLPAIRKTGRYDTGDSRKEASVGFQMMCEALQSSRTARGKDAKPHHSINEARLINATLTGAFQGIERRRLVKSDLDLLIRLEHENEFLLRQAKPYAERKAFLIDYARQRLASKPARKPVAEMCRLA